MSTTHAAQPPPREHRQAQDRAGSDRDFFAGLGRAAAGALIFATPMLMTMELWWTGFYISPWRLIVLILATIPLLTGLSMVNGFKRTEALRDDAIDAFVAIVVATAVSTAVLLVFGIVTFETHASEVIGRVALQAFPASIGAMLSRSQVSGEKPEHGARPSSYARALVLMAVGALFFGLSVAPTDEIQLLAYRMPPWRELAMVLLSLALMHAFVYGVEFSDAAKTRPDTSFWGVFLKFTVVGYAVVLLLSLCLLWLFGRVDDTDPVEILCAVIVLGFPCSIGAAAARLVV